MRSKGLTLAEVADYLEISVRTVCNIEDNYAVGSKNTSTSFAGVVQDGGSSGGGVGGSLTKVGSGILTLSGANVYNGLTTINGGNLNVTGSIISNVTVNNGGTLGGSGNTGMVTVNPGGRVWPGGPQILTVSGDYSQDKTAILQLTITGTDADSFDQLIVTGNVNLVNGAILELDFTNHFAPKAGDEFALITFGSISGNFATINITGLDQGFQYTLGDDGAGHIQLTALNDGISTNPNLLNVSTRMQVLNEDNVLIGGFVITGSAAKRVILRAIGPSLESAGIALPLADPVLELHEPNGSIVTNDNWKDTQEAEIEATGIAPTDARESAIVATLVPNAYTAIVRGNGGGTGTGLVEVYDLDQAGDSTLANISTRGFVDTGDNVMIGGTIIGSALSQILVRAIGPELTGQGVTGALQDTTLELHDQDGTLVGYNDDWKESQQSEIESTTIPPTDNRESAIVATLSPGAYTAVVRGKDSGVGVALVEFYNITP